MNLHDYCAAEITQIQSVVLPLAPALSLGAVNRKSKSQELYDTCLTWVPVSYSCPPNKISLLPVGEYSLLLLLHKTLQSFVSSTHHRLPEAFCAGMYLAYLQFPHGVHPLLKPSSSDDRRRRHLAGQSWRRGAPPLPFGCGIDPEARPSPRVPDQAAETN